MKVGSVEEKQAYINLVVQSRLMGKQMGRKMWVLGRRNLIA